MANISLIIANRILKTIILEVSLFYNPNINLCDKQINDEMIYELDYILTALMKSSEAVIFAVGNTIFAIA